jgi:hypothetical protein
MHEFMSMTYYEWSCRSSGYAIRQYKEWERTRYLGWLLVKVNSTKDDKKGPEDFLPLPTDPEKQIIVATSKEDRMKLFEQSQERLRLFQQNK